MKERMPAEWFQEIDLLLQEIQEYNVKAHFENSVHSCIQAGPLTLLIYLRMAKLTLDQKSQKREKNLEYFDMQELYLHDICTSSVSSTSSDGGLKFINRLIQFFIGNMRDQ